MRRLAPMFLTCALAACSRPEAPADPSGLQSVVEAATGLAPCRRTIPMEWANGWPVPAEEGARRFKLFFYPLTGGPGSETKLYAPSGEALLDAGKGQSANCARLPGEPRALSARRWPDSLRGVSMEQFEARSAGLYAKTEAVAAAFAARPAPAAQDKALAAEYLASFEAMAEPDLLPYYYRLNPAFWEWVRSAAGRSIPKA